MGSIKLNATFWTVMMFIFTIIMSIISAAFYTSDLHNDIQQLQEQRKDDVKDHDSFDGRLDKYNEQIIETKVIVESIEDDVDEIKGDVKELLKGE